MGLGDIHHRNAHILPPTSTFSVLLRKQLNISKRTNQPKPDKVAVEEGLSDVLLLLLKLRNPQDDISILLDDDDTIAMTNHQHAHKSNKQPAFACSLTSEYICPYRLIYN